MIVDSPRSQQIELADSPEIPGGRSDEPPCPPCQNPATSCEDEPGGSTEDQKSQLADLERKLDELIAVAESQSSRIAELAARDEILTNLHRRMAAFEQDEQVRSFIEPLVRKAAPMHRRLVEQQSYARTALQTLPKALRNHSPYYWVYQALKSFRVELETLLGDFGVEILERDDPSFDRSCQTVIVRIPTSDDQRDGTVSHSVAPGFKIGDRVIVPQRVVIFVCSS